MAELSIKHVPYKLLTASPFGTAHGVRTHTDIIFLSLKMGEYIGYGEASMPPYYAENQESMSAFFAKLDASKIASCDTAKELHQLLAAISPNDTAAKAAIDMAYHDLMGQVNGYSVQSLYGDSQESKIYSSFTIGTGPIETVLQKVREAAEFPILKIKLNGQDDVVLMRKIRSISDQELWVDANQAWVDTDYAISTASELQKIDVKLIEQPFKIGEYDKVQALRDAIDIPIVADEDCQRLCDVEILSKYYDAINIKLMKCSGIYEAHQMISSAQQKGLKVMLGCMTESSVGISAAAALASLVDWCDLDGNLLISNDVCEGAKMVKGILKIPKYTIGLGLSDKRKLEMLVDS